jgi:hypothetical protein
MSYTIQEARLEQDMNIVDAIVTRDSEALYQLAGIVKEQGDDEEAERLQTIARQIDREDSQQDQARADRDQDFNDQYEMAYYPAEGNNY